VISGSTGEAQHGVEVVLTRRGNLIDQRSVTTDAGGGFEIVGLPNGEWTIGIAERPRVVSYLVITISGGGVTDEQGRRCSRVTLYR
jgi:hypothetical protein